MNPEDTQKLLAVLDRIAVSLETLSSVPVFKGFDGDLTPEVLEALGETWQHPMPLIVTDSQSATRKLVRDELLKIFKAL
jgi:hypothetical protein